MSFQPHFVSNSCHFEHMSFWTRVISTLFHFKLLSFWTCATSNLCHTNSCHFELMSFWTCVTLNLCHMNSCHFELMSFWTHVTLNLYYSNSCNFELMSLWLCVIRTCVGRSNIVNIFFFFAMDFNKFNLWWRLNRDFEVSTVSYHYCRFGHHTKGSCPIPSQQFFWCLMDR